MVALSLRHQTEVPLAIEWHLHVLLVGAVGNAGCFVLCH